MDVAAERVRVWPVLEKPQNVGDFSRSNAKLERTASVMIVFWYLQFATSLIN